MSGTILTKHEACLQSMCRVCGVNMPINGQTFPKEKFQKQISTVYGIDVTEDIAMMHPPKVCNACRMRLSRVGRSDDPVSVNFPSLHSYRPHNADCDICNKKVGKKSKSSKAMKTKLTFQKRQNEGSSTSSASEYEDEVSHKTDHVDKFATDVQAPLLPNTVIDSVHTELFSSSVASIFTCTICQGVSNGTIPVKTTCEHIFCKSCIDGWLSVSPACPVCRTCLEDTDVMPLHGHLLEVFDSLTVVCVECKATVPQIDAYLFLVYLPNICVTRESSPSLTWSMNIAREKRRIQRIFSSLC